MGSAGHDRLRAFITVDYEDYRRQELRDRLNPNEPPHPEEVVKQTDILLDALEALALEATFFAVGRLVKELPSSVWRRITQRHRLGCHSLEHRRVTELGPEGFMEDTRIAKTLLEDATGTKVVSYRAPYFSVDGCSPWYGEVLAELGFEFDSSQRLNTPPPAFSGSMALEGSNGTVRLVPFPSIGLGHKRLTIIGGTYFRLLPTAACRALLHRSHRAGFSPMVYLHPYDLDPDAPALSYPRRGYLTEKLGDRVRRSGRRTARRKLEVLARDFDFGPIERLAMGSSS